MKATIKDGLLQVDIFELLDGLTDEEKRDIADRLAINDSIIKDVADQIITGWTDGGSNCKGLLSPEPRNAIDIAIRRVAENAGTVASEHVKEMAAAWAQAERYHRQIYDWAWCLYHATRDAGRVPIDPPVVCDKSDDKWEVVRATSKKGEDHGNG